LHESNGSGLCLSVGISRYQEILAVTDPAEYLRSVYSRQTSNTEFYVSRTDGPATGLTPTFVSWQKATDGTSVSAPTVTEISAANAPGHYKVAASGTDTQCGYIDLGSDIYDGGRYLPFIYLATANLWVVPASVQGIGITGLTPTITKWGKPDGTSLTPPAVTEVGNGFYKFTYDKTVPASGTMDLGAGYQFDAGRVFGFACPQTP